VSFFLFLAWYAMPAFFLIYLSGTQPGSLSAKVPRSIHAHRRTGTYWLQWSQAQRRMCSISTLGAQSSIIYPMELHCALPHSKEATIVEKQIYVNCRWLFRPSTVVKGMTIPYNDNDGTTPSVPGTCSSRS